jgi:hypothetical protein
VTYATAGERARLTAGLRELAEFLIASPETPCPEDTIVYVFPAHDGTDADRRAEIDAIASRLRTQPHETRGGHYVASRFFGSVEYMAVAIPRENPEAGKGREQK